MAFQTVNRCISKRYKKDLTAKIPMVMRYKIFLPFLFSRRQQTVPTLNDEDERYERSYYWN